MNLYDYPEFKMFSSEDKDAPQLEKALHSFSTILKACLITGYGEKQAVSGWIMPIDDIDNTGIRSFCSHTLHSSRCEYRISNDNVEQFTLSAYREHEDRAFATIHRSKRMWNISTKQRWFVIANEISCYVLLQTDLNQPWFAVLFFGMAYSNHELQRIAVLLGGDVHYTQSNYSINDMPLHTELGDSFTCYTILPTRLNLSHQSLLYPPFFKKDSADYVVLLPAFFQNVSTVPNPENHLGYVLDSSQTLFFQTAWAETRSFGLRLKGGLI